MGIDWKMTRVPRVLAERLNDMKEDEDEGLWKPVARDIMENDPELEQEIKRKDPDVAKELGLDDGLFSGEQSDSFSIR